MERTEMEQEAIRRLETLKSKGLMGTVVGTYKRSNTVYYSEFNGIFGALYYFNDLGGAKPEWVEKVKELEEHYGFLVYHITHEYAEFGELLDLFIVSKYEEDWNYERELLERNCAYCYVINLDEPDYSEFGSIGYKCLGGGIVRTA